MHQRAGDADMGRFDADTRYWATAGILTFLRPVRSACRFGELGAEIISRNGVPHDYNDTILTGKRTDG